MVAKSDFTVVVHGLICILEPHSDDAAMWVGEHIESPQWWGKGFAIDPRYVEDVIAGIEMAGMKVS